VFLRSALLLRRSTATTTHNRTPMEDAAPSLESLVDLERQHDEVLRRLDELDRRIETVLAACRLEWGAGGPEAPAILGGR
jgi:hypothetical protein